jgi:AcrR family transcriptional regulator
MVLMAATAKRAQRRPDALSKERIVEAAIEILDAEGESALTFRALTARLATAAGRSTGTSPTRTTCWRRPPTTSSLGS